MTDIQIPEEIIEDFEKLSGAALKLFMVFRKMTGEIKEAKWIHCGYDYLLAETHLSSKTSIRKGLLELAGTGWIIGFRRGYIAGRRRVANQYLISPEKNLQSGMEIVIKMQDFESKRNRSS